MYCLLVENRILFASTSLYNIKKLRNSYSCSRTPLPIIHVFQEITDSAIAFFEPLSKSDHLSVVHLLNLNPGSTNKYSCMCRVVLFECCVSVLIHFYNFILDIDIFL